MRDSKISAIDSLGRIETTTYNRAMRIESEQDDKGVWTTLFHVIQLIDQLRSPMDLGVRWRFTIRITALSLLFGPWDIARQVYDATGRTVAI